MWSLLVSISLVLIGITLFLFLNKDFIKNQTINALNSQLDAKVDVRGKIDLTFLSSFPQINLNFQDVFIEDKLRLKDTLAHVQSVDLSLNPWSILRKDYTINGIAITNGFLHIYTDRNGLSNYNILKEEDEAAKESTLLKLSRIDLINMDIMYDDRSNNTYINFFTTSSKVSGTFQEQDFTLKIKTALVNKRLVVDNTAMLENKKIEGALSLNYTGTDGCILFKDNTIQVEGNTFTLNGDICTKSKTLSFVAQAEGRDLQNVLALVPTEWIDARKINGNGSYQVKASLQGDLNSPETILNFTIDNGTLHIPEENLDLNNLSVSGSYSNVQQKNGSLFIDHFECTTLNSSIKGKFDILDLSKIKINTSINGHLAQELLNKYMPNAVQLDKGTIDVNTLSLVIEQKDSLWQLKKVEGEIALSDLEGVISTLNLPFFCQGKLIGRENYLSALDLQLKIGENDLSFDGELRNFLELVLNQNNAEQLDLGILGSIKSAHFNLNDFIQENAASAAESETKAVYLPPINGNLSINIEHFEYQKLVMKNVRVQSTAQNTAYTFKIDNAETLGGKINGVLITNVNGNDFEINLSTNIYAVDIQQLFEAFDNFGQEDMGSENLRGSLTSQLSLSAVWKDFSTFDPSSFILSSHIELKDGELINFSPLMSLAGKLEVEQLEHLYFTDLNADVFIKDQIIHMPMTEIQSNLLSMQVGGKHHFDNSIDYSLVLNLKNLLAAKFKKKQTTNENFVNDIKGGINLYISMTGSVDNPVITYDRDSVKDKIKEDFKAEKQEFKNLFKKEEKSEFEKNEIKFEELKEEDKYLEWEE